MLAPWCEFERSEEPVLRLGQQSIAWWSQRTSVEVRGTLVVAAARDRDSLSTFARRTHDFSMVDGPQIAQLEPDLAGRFSRGLFFKKEAHLDVRRALGDLKRTLLERGCRFETTECTSTGLRVDCRGLAARDVLTDLRGVKGEMLIIRCPEVQLTRPVRFLHPRIPLYIVPRDENLYMIGATMIESDDRQCVTARSVLELLSAAYALNPAFGEAEIVEIGVDARPAFPDNLPRIRRKGSVIYVNGLYRHGYLMAPAMAGQVAEYILNGTQPEMMDEN
ncbi:MAG: FAD-dependent oxidoreductase [Kiritimatiellaceae bacterium]|nr:FAD-dependent oxidoreductase [Kiritimatiellaceae bacterium]